MTHRSRGSARTALTRAAFVTAPLLILAYGVIRLTDPDHGPGPVWTTGHLALTAAMLLFVPVFARTPVDRLPACLPAGAGGPPPVAGAAPTTARDGGGPYARASRASPSSLVA
ncbi:hypothetical protein ACFYN3_00470 [Streptomyces lavendulae]|uniref:hypothetical protein n=1 Tax=Streptomyces lavendulae TaxID=1914 RepID=UPI0036A534E3